MSKNINKAKKIGANFDLTRKDLKFVFLNLLPKLYSNNEA